MGSAAPIILPYRGIWPRIADDAFVAPGAVVVGDVEIGPMSSVWFGCILRGDVQSIRIGARVNIQDATVIHVSRYTHGTEIGDDVSIGHSVLLHSAILKPGSFVGMGSTVMDEVVVETGGFVAAGSLVTPGKRVASGELWSGRPARLARATAENEAFLIRTTTENYVALSREYLHEPTAR